MLSKGTAGDWEEMTKKARTANVSGCTLCGTPRMFAGALFRQRPEAPPGILPARPLLTTFDFAAELLDQQEFILLIALTSVRGPDRALRLAPHDLSGLQHGS